jgi:hypothetical protein
VLPKVVFYDTFTVPRMGVEGVNFLRYLAPVEAVEYNPGVSTREN